MSAHLIKYIWLVSILITSCATLEGIKRGGPPEKVVGVVSKSIYKSRNEELQAAREQRKGAKLDEKNRREEASSHPDIIQPFGGLDWHDGFVDVIVKLNSMPGIERIEFAMDKSQTRNIKGIVNKSKIEDEINWAIRTADSQKVISSSKGRLKFSRRDIAQVAWGLGATVQAYPIVISGVPCMLTANFTNSPGLAVVAPEKVLKGNRGLVLQEVELTSDSPILADQYMNIQKIIDEKYLSKDNNRLLIDDHGMAATNRKVFLAGEFGRIIYPGLDGYISSEDLRITYSDGGYYIGELEEALSKREATVESRKIKGKKDMSGGL